MAILQNYYRIITPVSQQKQYNTLATDSNDSNHFGASASISWYSQVMKGAGSRLQRYIQYDSMDNDIDIARALDIIAEECSNDDNKTNLPFEIEYQTEDDEEVSETLVTTIRAALRHWVKLQDLNNRIFRTARILAKYGDCFFQKKVDTRKWEYLDPSKIFGIELNKDGDRVAFHIKDDGGQMVGFGAKQADISVVPAASIIHFTLSDDMGESMPFGESVLQPIFRTFKQLSMIEDSVIIYRIVRAPERRVFYIDVGNMAPQRVKQYLENIKNELRQKRIPNTTGGADTIDGTYNPASISEDFFMPVTASGRSSRVEVLPGGENLGELAELKYFRDKLFRGLRIPLSYMAGPENNGAQYSDGKVGIAYIEELRFANYIRRIQNKLEAIYDKEFKTYLKAINLNIEDWIFILRLPEPQNFALFRQAAVDADLANTYKTMEDVRVLSTRFKLRKYLGLTTEDLQVNEGLLKEELGIDDSGQISDIRQIYDPIQMEARLAIKMKPKLIAPKAAEDGGLGGEEDLGGGLPPELSGGPEEGGGEGALGGMPELGI